MGVREERRKKRGKEERGLGVMSDLLLPSKFVPLRGKRKKGEGSVKKLTRKGKRGEKGHALFH